jgi:alkylhydroperoxidase family enzyme
MTWLGTEAEGRTALERTLGLHPAAEEALREFYSMFWTDDLVDPVLLELIRLRIAKLHGVESELRQRYDVARDAGLDEEKIAALPLWPTSPLYSDLDRAVLGLTEQFVVDAHGVTDDDVTPLREALGTPGLVALLNAIGLIDHINRIRTVFEIPPATDEVVVVPAPSPTIPLS